MREEPAQSPHRRVGWAGAVPRTQRGPAGTGQQGQIRRGVKSARPTRVTHRSAALGMGETLPRLLLLPMDTQVPAGFWTSLAILPVPLLWNVSVPSPLRAWTPRPWVHRCGRKCLGATASAWVHRLPWPSSPEVACSSDCRTLHQLLSSQQTRLKVSWVGHMQMLFHFT